MTNWALGAYETFAPELEPAARGLVQIAAPRIGEATLDVGCGTGNATLVLAQSGAAVTAVDPASRLVDLARERLSAAGLPATWHVGAAEALPLEDASFDLVVSVFGVVFSERPAHALDELLRVLRPGGRLVYSAWLPDGAIAEGGRMLRAAVHEQAGTSASDLPSGPVWHEPASIASLVPGGEGTIHVHDRTMEFGAASARDWIALHEASHPLWVHARGVLDDAQWRGVVDRLAVLLDHASTDPTAMRVAAPYRVVEVRPEPE